MNTPNKEYDSEDSRTITEEHSETAETAIKDVTPIPHNGCRPPKRRRVQQ